MIDEKTKAAIQENINDMKLTDRYTKQLKYFIDTRCTYCGTQSCSPHDSENLFGCVDFVKYLTRINFVDMWNRSVPEDEFFEICKKASELIGND